MRNGFTAPALGLTPREPGAAGSLPLLIPPVVTSGPPLQPAFITALCCQASLFFASLGLEQSLQPGLQLASTHAGADTRVARAVLASYLSMVRVRVSEP